MAIALQNANLVRQKAMNAPGLTPQAFYALKSWFLYMAANKGNPDLQFIPFDAGQIVTNLGYSPDVDAARVYVLFLKGRRTTGTTAAFVSLHDATDNSASTTTVWTAKFNVTGQDYFFASPTGHLLTTELTVACATAVGGATESAEADAADGFVIVGA